MLLPVYPLRSGRITPACMHRSILLWYEILVSNQTKPVLHSRLPLLAAPLYPIASPVFRRPCRNTLPALYEYHLSNEPSGTHALFATHGLPLCSRAPCTAHCSPLTAHCSPPGPPFWFRGPCWVVIPSHQYGKITPRTKRNPEVSTYGGGNTGH